MTRDEEIRRAAGNVAIRDNKGQYAHGFLMQALREAFTEGAQWADRTLIERASQWLQENCVDIVIGYLRGYTVDDFVEQFKKAIKAEVMEFNVSLSESELYEQRGLEDRLQDYWQDVRERAAIAAMQGILCAPIVEGIDPNPSKEHIAELAVAQADALIEELKKK